MLDTVKTLEGPGDDPMIIAAPALASLREQRRLLEQARKRAAQLVEEANQSAQATRLAAYREGYLYGVSHAVGDIGQWLIGARGAGERLRGEVQQQLHSLFQSLMIDGNWPCQRLEQWLEEQPKAAQHTLHVVLPAVCREKVPAWRERLGQCWEGAIKVECHDQDRFVFCLGEQVLELDVPVAAQAQARYQAHTLKGLAAEATRLDAEALKGFREWFESLVQQLAPEVPA
ncbi:MULTISPECIES: hypothetical protein [Pseudomonas]|uniref:Oxygen-regulated invasion protein OrgB n=1 Tax=Pseudomonas quercus TaxID=2722792 RepID=A0ABX0Y8J2_9PSED|nr:MULTISPECIES: hypothetical protein [Pseudomonas]MBF7141027.1 hypothetical protein [Pseudomonas sp. LY10J]NJO99561.1 hypothetical protein [Pseudomonas quercus]